MKALGCLLLLLVTASPAFGVAISALTSTNALQSTNLFEVTVQQGGSNASYKATLQTIANSMPTVPSAASLAGSSTNTAAHAYNSTGQEFFTVNGTNGLVTVQLGPTNGLVLQGPSGGAGYQFFWRSDHLWLTNTVTGSWLDLGGGGTLGEMTLGRSDGVKLLVVDSSGNVTAPGMATLQAVDNPTNTLATSTTVFNLGTNSFLTSGAVTFGFASVKNVPTSTERFGQLTIVATGNITLTNDPSIHASDFATSRVLTNGNTACIAMDVVPGQTTNMAVVQFK